MPTATRAPSVLHFHPVWPLSLRHSITRLSVISVPETFPFTGSRLTFISQRNLRAKPTFTLDHHHHHHHHPSFSSVGVSKSVPFPTFSLRERSNHPTHLSVNSNRSSYITFTTWFHCIGFESFYFGKALDCFLLHALHESRPQKHIC